MKIYIDSNVFVSNILDDEREKHNSSKEFIDYILDNKFPEDFSFITSRFTEVEVASAVFRRTKSEEKAQATLYKLEKPWRNKIDLLPENPKEKVKIEDLIIKLIETALRYGTTFGDTVHANDVESFDIDYLVTWNIKDFKIMSEKIKKLRVITPDEMLLELKRKISGSSFLRNRQIPDTVLNIIKRISIKSNLPVEEIEKRVEEKRIKLSGLVSYEGCSKIVASELGVDKK